MSRTRNNTSIYPTRRLTRLRQTTNPPEDVNDLIGQPDNIEQNAGHNHNDDSNSDKPNGAILDGCDETLAATAPPQQGITGQTTSRPHTHSRNNSDQGDNDRGIEHRILAPETQTTDASCPSRDQSLGSGNHTTSKGCLPTPEANTEPNWNHKDDDTALKKDTILQCDQIQSIINDIQRNKWKANKESLLRIASLTEGIKRAHMDEEHRAETNSQQLATVSTSITITPPPNGATKDEQIAKLERKVEGMTSVLGRIVARLETPPHGQALLALHPHRRYAEVLANAPPHGTPHQNVGQQVATQGTPAAIAATTASARPPPAVAPQPTRVTLRVSRLDPAHHLRMISNVAVLRLVAEQMKAHLGFTPSAIQRLPSGDLAVMLQTEEQVQKTFNSDDQWIHDAFDHMGATPELNRPGSIRQLTLVVHGVSCSTSEEEMANDLAQTYAVSIRRARWIVGPQRREHKSHSSMVIETDTQAQRDTLLNMGRIWTGRQTIHTAEYRPRPTIDQCSRCQQFGHVEDRCNAPRPTCRICSMAHHTTAHPPCRYCHAPGQPPPPDSKPHCMHFGLKCANCGGEHAASSRGCPARLQFTRTIC